MDNTFDTFLEFLKFEFEKRCALNSQYSLRSFASFLDTDVSYLSKVFKSKINMSEKTIYLFSQKLKLNDQETYRYLVTNINESRREHQVHPYTEYLDSNFKQLEEDELDILSNWYYFAILSLTKLKCFQSNTEWIANRLGLDLNTCKSAIDKMFSLKMLTLDENKNWVCNNAYSLPENKYSTESAIKLQQQILGLASSAIENYPKEFREQLSLTLAVNTELIPLAKEKIKEFTLNLNQLLQAGENSDDVYQFCTSLFPVTIKNQIKE